MGSAASRRGGNRLVLVDCVRRAGGVGVFVDGGTIEGVMSQCWRRIGGRRRPDAVAGLPRCRRAAVHVQRTGPAPLRGPEPRFRCRRRAARVGPGGRSVLRRRARAGRWPQLPPRVHGQPRPVLLSVARAGPVRGSPGTVWATRHTGGQRGGGAAARTARPPRGPAAGCRRGAGARVRRAPVPVTDLEQQGIDVIRGLAMDAVQAANSRHPGTPMALAPLGHVLFTRVMRYDASRPEWPDRDRFVLSNGHASMLLYALLYLTGFGLELDDLRAFRQWQSRTPGHPEYRHAPGIEVTTGPLGQGFANSVGIALAEANLRGRFGPEVSDHHPFVSTGDGDFEEGGTHEPASLPGLLGFGRLTCVYADNHITTN